MLWNIFKREPKPFDEGYLPVKDGHRIFYKRFGNPNGIPVLSFHGGPGGSSRPKYAKLFDKKKYHFIQFDQRGCGNSTAEDIVFHNTTADTLEDANRLLEHLNITAPIISHGASWGSTLALLFAQKYPQKVCKIIVSSVFLARKYDADWVRVDSEHFYPDLWAQMRDKINGHDVYSTYRKLLFSSCKKDNLKALSYLGSFEFMLGKLSPKFKEFEEIDEDELRSARVYYHYDANDFFVKENQILKNIRKIKHIDTLIVHNRMDFCCTPKQAWDLHKALPNARFVLNPDYGHSTPKLFAVVKKEVKKFLQD